MLAYVIDMAALFGIAILMVAVVLAMSLVIGP